MNINTLVVNIFYSNGQVLSPIYEVHTWEKAEEIISNTRKSIAEGTDPKATFQFSVQGSVN
jgi:hypothetical protein